MSFCSPPPPLPVPLPLIWAAAGTERETDAPLRYICRHKALEPVARSKGTSVEEEEEEEELERGGLQEGSSLIWWSNT